MDIDEYPVVRGDAERDFLIREIERIVNLPVKNGGSKSGETTGLPKSTYNVAGEIISS